MRLLDGLVGEHLAHGGVHPALGERGRDPGLLERGVREVPIRGECVEGALGALDRRGERGSGVHHRVVEHPLAVGGLAGRAVVLHGARRHLDRVVAVELHDVGHPDLVRHALRAPPDVGERAAAPYAPDGVDQLAGRAGELGAPAEAVADEADGSGRKVGERFGERVHLAPRDLLHVVELPLELGELAGHGPHLADLVRDLGHLVHDHLGPLDRAADVEEGVGGTCAREHQDRDQEGGGKGADLHGRPPLMSLPRPGPRNQDVGGEPDAQAVAGADREGGEPVQEPVQDRVGALSESLADARLKPVGRGAGEGEAAQDTDCSRGREGREVVAVDLVGEGAPRPPGSAP